MAYKVDASYMVPEWVDTNHRICEMFGIDPATVDRVTIELSATAPPIVTLRKMWTCGKDVERREQMFELVPVKDEADNGD